MAGSEVTVVMAPLSNHSLQSNTHHRNAHHINTDSLSNGQKSLATSPTAIISPLNRRDNYFGSQFMLGLTIAGVAFSLLVTVFGLFHVDVFLRVYKLPLQTYSFGNIVFSLINTANDFLGAWWLDSMVAHETSRSDMIGIAGCIFAICFLAPFFRWKIPSTKWDGLHFIVSMSLYDTLYSFMAILLGSLVTDNHTMNDHERVWFMASGKIANLVGAFGVARIGLALFDENNLHRFRGFLLFLAVMVAFMFVVAQVLTRYSIVVQWTQWMNFRLRFLDTKKSQEEDVYKKNAPKLQFRQVFRDFWNHKNFWAWVGMELFLESQVSFANAFLKTFMDRLVYDSGSVSRESCDWLLSIIRPLGLICGVLCYIPIRRLGYRKVYPILFAVNASLCLFILLTASHASTNVIIAFLVIYPTLTGAVMSSGFHLVMSDMVLEMKKMHALEQGRLDEPSLAGLFMGMNALFCKPAESFLPVVAANMLGNLDLASEGSEEVQKVLFKLLIVPPLIFSLVELISWSRYTLTPAKTSQMREDLRMIHHNRRAVANEIIL